MHLARQDSAMEKESNIPYKKLNGCRSSNAMLSKVPWKPTLLWTLVGFSLVALTVFIHLQATWRPHSFSNHEYFYYNLEAEEPEDASQVCQIPRIHPFDPSILSYITSAKPIVCKVRSQPLTYVDEDGVLRFNLTAVTLSDYKVEDLVCSYQEVIRPEGNDWKVSYGEKRALPRNGTKLEYEFVSVSCYNFAGIAFYSNIHLHVVPKRKRKPRTSNTSRQPYNVLIVGIDSLSRLSFIRHMPKTYRYLTESMKSFVFRGMTKVGDNTFPNLVALLTGKEALGKELPTIEKGQPYDSWPCTWKNFSDRGYATMFAEDRPDIALFNYLRGGFHDPPTDHYMRPYWLAVSVSAVHRLSSNLCYGSVPKHLLQLNYTGDFVRQYSKKKDARPFFGFSFFVELSHDYMSRVSVADEDFRRWMSDLHARGYFDRTFMFFISDHGHRFDPMRATLVGRIEERMPFVSLAVPPVVHQQHPEVIAALKQNLGRLTSPYDLHATLVDILQYSTAGSDLGGNDPVVAGLAPRGVSLFGPISANRTCLIAGIPEHYCVCEEEKSLDIKDSRAIQAAEVLTLHINQMLQDHNASLGLCHRLNLTEIRRAELIVPNRKVVVNSRVYFGKLVEDGEATGMITRLRIVIRTVPGNALFEGTLVHREDDDEMSVLGDISRINKYSTQSWCVNDAVLRKYCFCRSQPSTDASSR